MPRKIAFFGLVKGASRDAFGEWETYLARVAAAVVARSGQSLVIDLVATGPVEHNESVAPGVFLRVLPAREGWPNPSDAASSRLAHYLSAADMVHIHIASTALCEWAALLCALRGLPLCVTQNTLSGQSLFADLGIVRLADAVICHSPAAARRLGGGLRVTVLPSKLANVPGDDFAFGLVQVYQQVFATKELGK